jgi:hypothetical protein
MDKIISHPHDISHPQFLHNVETWKNEEIHRVSVAFTSSPG